ncbi:ImmA/IrrE family metallo-endopeptidase [Rhizobium laguerreae]|uniref:ImmA/IrrE family metallo-endopeptidase n=1 Tax=Rhizobium laguerreae TaxID=1076926 RepID=UPI001C90AD84|nr:ImmA/IrrE family metallo-endopeptidase [Rhizobium laguerreae]MBY3529445.1 ImmA/IrrE family metallo-endopeptidase [Rhizobium laguerreae]
MANKEEAREQATELLAQFNVRSAPVPIDRIVRGMGITVQYAPFDGDLSGMAFVKDGKKIIGVNSLHSATRQRFTIAHELAHFVLHLERLEAKVHVDKGVLRRDTLASEGTDDVEIEANNFAAELLMPRSLLITALGGKNLDLEDDEAIASFAKKFKVSPMALQYRIQQL